MHYYKYLIIGGGMMADAAVQAIRKLDSNGSVGLVSADSALPYDRPPLTKGLWKGESIDSIWRKTDELNVDLHRARIIQALDSRSKRATNHIPFFYSDLFDLGYEAVGEVDARLEMVSDWKEPYQEGVVYYLKNDRVRGVLLWNVPNQVDAARQLIAEAGPFHPEDLKGKMFLQKNYAK